MIDAAKLDALEHQLRNRHFDGLAPELIEVIGLARLVLAAQAAPGEVEAVAKAIRDAWDEIDSLPPLAFSDPESVALARAALLAASIHRPVEAREPLRAALEKIAGLIDSEADDPLDDAIDIARKALAATPISVEARVTEEMLEAAYSSWVARDGYMPFAAKHRWIGNMRAALEAALALPSPQVTRGEE